MVMIYESPDGGRTVYERVSGQRRRRLVSQDHVDPGGWSSHRQLWDLILFQSITDIELKNMIQQVEVYYTLRYTKSHD